MLLFLMLAGCGGPVDPAERGDALADRYGFTTGTLRAKGFELRIYRHGRAGAGQPLHVYLEGDGRPWRSRTQISLDPTPRRLMALELMALDRNPSLYLGRPCYFGQARAPGCSPQLWTSARYSETVVASMTEALNTLVTEEQIQELTLIGYSGGGFIAWLMAERLPRVTRLVTIAANLDVEAWTRHHGYSPLTGSLDPSKRPPLPGDLQHWHLIGLRDIEVPPKLSDPPGRSELQGAHLLRLDVDHACCWPDHWPAILHLIQTTRPRGNHTARQRSADVMHNTPKLFSLNGKAFRHRYAVRMDRFAPCRSRGTEGEWAVREQAQLPLR